MLYNAKNINEKGMITMNNYELIYPDLEHKEEVLAMLEEIRVADDGLRWQYSGMSSLEEYESYEDWVKKVMQESTGKNLAQNRVPASTYIMINKDNNKVVGIVNIRHQLNEYLLNYGGHIGYSVRPKERQKGLGTHQLKLALEKSKSLGIQKVLITCDTENEGSAKVIENCQGQLENIVPKDDFFTKRYWISL